MEARRERVGELGTHHRLRILRRCRKDLQTLPDGVLELAHIDALGPAGIVDSLGPQAAGRAQRACRQVLLALVDVVLHKLCGEGRCWKSASASLSRGYGAQEDKEI